MNLTTNRSLYFILLFTTGLLLFIILAWFSYLFFPLLISLTVISGGVIIVKTGFKIPFLLLALSLPISINIQMGEGGNKLMFPSELITLTIACALIFQIFTKNYFPKNFIRHPVMVSLILYLTWMLVAVFFSTDKVVSAKYFLVQTGYILVFFAGSFLLIQQDEKKAKTIFSIYMLSLFLLILYVLFRHWGYQFSKESTGYVVKPFFNDHTIYSCVIAMHIPLVLARITWYKLFKSSYLVWITSIILACTLIIAIFLASSRAAWLSLGAGFLVFLLLLVRIKFRGFIILFIGITSLVAVNYENIVWQLKQNKFDSNAWDASVEDQTKSIFNVSNDRSNMERINRWSCAVRMFRERPITGFGPGTYQVQYIPYQKQNEKTVLSVESPYNIPDGRGGSAHSEPLLALSEQGLPGFAFILLVFFFIANSAFKVFYGSKSKKDRIWVAALFIGLVTYATHGLFNNFLETDKAAFLFWSLAAGISWLHIKQENQPDTPE